MKPTFLNRRLKTLYKNKKCQFQILILVLIFTFIYKNVHAHALRERQNVTDD